MKNNNPNQKKTILIIANCTWYLYNFRSELLEELKKKGHNLILLSTTDEYAKYIKKYFVKVNRLFLIRGSDNLILEFFTVVNIFYYFLKYKPYLVHNFTIKPSIYGGIVGRFLGTKKILNHITGLGPSFFSKSKKRNLLNKVFNPIYKFAFKNANTINIFHNQADRNAFIEFGLSNIQNSKIIQGSGVDANHFKINHTKNKFNKHIQILFPARIIKEKGIMELINACKELWRSNYKFVLNIAGEIDFQNKSYLNKKYFDEIIKNKNINFIGKSNNMVEVYKKMDIVVLPSWREGLSKSLLEASAMNLPIITTNVPGCNDIVINNYSGLLISVKDENNLKNAIKKFLENQELAISYGINARKIVKKKFTINIINDQILNLYNI